MKIDREKFLAAVLIVGAVSSTACKKGSEDPTPDDSSLKGSAAPGAAGAGTTKKSATNTPAPNAEGLPGPSKEGIVPPPAREGIVPPKATVTAPPGGRPPGPIKVPGKN